MGTGNDVLKTGSLQGNSSRLQKPGRRNLLELTEAGKKASRLKDYVSRSEGGQLLEMYLSELIAIFQPLFLLQP